MSQAPRPDATLLPPVLLAVALILGVTAWRLAALSASDLNLIFDEAQYWSWSRDPAFGYFSKPPMIAWIIAASTALCGDSEFCIRLGSPLFHGATSLVVLALGARMFGATVGAVAGVVFATLPGISFSAGIISTDVPLLFFWALGLLLLDHALRGDGLGRWLMLGVAVGLGLLSKYTMVLFGACALLYLVSSPSHRRQLARPGIWLASATALIVLAPNIWWNATNGFATVAHLGDNANLGGSLLNFDKFAEFFGAQFAVFGPILLAGLLYLAARWRRSARDDTYHYLLCFSVPVLALISLQALLSRAHANWAAVTYVGAAILVSAWLMRQPARRWLAGAVALHVIAMPALYHFDFLAARAGVAVTTSIDPFRRLRGWDVIGAQVSEMLAAHPGAVLLADERKHLVELLYYVRPFPEVAVKWNPGGGVRDHYELTTDIDTYADRRFLLVTRHPTVEHVEPRFAQASLLGEVTATPYDGLHLAFRVYLLEGFKGYGP